MSIAPIGGLGPVQIGSLGTETQAAGTGEAQAPGAASGEGSFAGTLGKALESLEGSQASAESAAAQVATGTTSNPEGAVVKTMNAQLEMQLASQIRSKATEALQTVFQTQV
jgi:flagellar hook-basal body complex protein FliE